MESRNEKTTVNLTYRAQKIKDKLAPALGLKGILSVGLELLENLTDSEKLKRVGQAMAEDKAASVVRKARAVQDAAEVPKQKRRAHSPKSA